MFKSTLHPFNKHRLPSLLAKSCLKAFLITLLLIDLAQDNCLFAAVRKLLFFKLLLVSRNNPMLIFDSYLHEMQGVINTAFPWVCLFKTLASPVRTERTIDICGRSTLPTGLKSAQIRSHHGSSSLCSTSYYDTVMLPRYYLLLHILDVVCFEYSVASTICNHLTFSEQLKQ